MKIYAQNIIAIVHSKAFKFVFNDFPIGLKQNLQQPLYKGQMPSP